MGKAFNAIAAAAESPSVVVVPCKAWDSDVRLVNLDPFDKLNVLAPMEDAEKDDDGTIIDKRVAWEFGVELLAACIVDEDGNRQITTPELRQWLMGEMSAVQELVPHAMQVNRLGTAAVDDETNAKKN